MLLRGQFTFGYEQHRDLDEKNTRRQIDLKNAVAAIFLTLMTIQLFVLSYSLVSFGEKNQDSFCMSFASKDRTIYFE